MSSGIGISGPGKERIGRQISLPFSKAFEVAWKGIKIRLWRSLITMSGIILAIAFLMSVWTSGVFTDSLKRVPSDHELYSLVQGVLEAEALAGSGLNIHAAVVAPLREQVEPGVGIAEGIRYGLSQQDGFGAEELPAQAEATVEITTQERALRPDAMVLVGFPEMLAQRRVRDALAGYVRDGGFLLIYGSSQLENHVHLQALLPASPREGVIRASGQTASATGHVAGAGVPWHRMPQAQFLATEGAADAEALATADGETIGWTTEVDRGTVAWFPVAVDFGGEADVLSWFVRGQALEGGEGEGRNSLLIRLLAHGSREKLGGAGGGDTRGTWLVVLSLLVCVVGITNAMLMSVTERFREIGTMKCLGALDIFVVKLFLIESALQGVVGSIAGAVIGFLLAFLRALFVFHVTDPETGQGYFLSLRFFPGSSLLGWLGIALAVGIGLSIVAAIYPAIRAARMQPVQAMRVEE